MYTTFGGLPRFLFGTSIPEFKKARIAAAEGFLFLLPIGRPRFRFNGTPSVSQVHAKKVSTQCIFHTSHKYHIAHHCLESGPESYQIRSSGR
jgi:hypothetical protein